MSLLRLAALAAVVATFALTPASVHAQDPDIIRGRITGPDSLPIQNATITATAISSNVSRPAKTDKNGVFTIIFANAEGDYWVNVAAVGYQARRFEVKKLSDEEILVADARLAKSIALLGPLQAIGKRPVASRNDILDISGSEKLLASGSVDFTQIGDLAALAASIPGVTLIPGTDGGASTFSLNGLDATQNTFLLNGIATDGSGLPRDAGLSSSLNTNPLGVGGGSNGGLVSTSGASGTNYIVRTGSYVPLTPQMQFADQTAEALGKVASKQSVGGRMAGPLKLNSAFYNLSVQLDDSTQPLKTLLNADNAALVAAGLSTDSLAQFQDDMQGLGLPFTLNRFPTLNERKAGTMFGQLDLKPPSATARSLQVTVNGRWSKITPFGTTLLAAPASAGTLTQWNGLVGVRLQAYVHNAFLSTLNLGFTTIHNDQDPYLSLPHGLVKVYSDLDDGLHVTNIGFGGATNIASGSDNTTMQLRHMLRWTSMSSTQSFNLTSELYRYSNHTDPSGNLFGTFTFNSLADLDAGIPASYTRTLTPQAQDAHNYAGDMILSDQWRVNPDLTMRFAVRADGNHFATRPQDNPEILRVFGVPNDAAPHPFMLSPSFTFNKTLGEAQQITVQDGAVRGPRWRVQGAFGAAQSPLQTSLLTAAVRSTGLPSAIQTLSCQGTAAPFSNWTSYLQDPANVPTTCADGTQGTAFSSTLPNVSLVDPKYRSQLSFTNNLTFTGPILNNRFSTIWRVGYVRTIHQSSQVPIDLNFNPTVRFNLTDEAGRPVYVEPTSIIPTTGVIAVRDARVSPEFNKVSETTSNLQSDARTFQVQLAPTAFASTFSWSASYGFQWNRRQVLGFQSNAGDPFDRQWTMTTNNPVHNIRLGLGYNIANVVTFRWSVGVSSGIVFTPQLIGDINGDGYSNDRPFVFNPANTADTAVAAAMKQLLQNGPSIAKKCLGPQVGKLAGLGSCSGPWTFQSGALSATITGYRLHLPQRAKLLLSISNPAAAADLLVHGSGGVHGWGQTPPPDATLLYLRGFNPTTDQYSYDVNPRFGSTSPQTSISRAVAPVTLNIQMNVDLGPVRERQLLSQTLDRGRSTDGVKATEATIKSSFGNNIVVNPMARILQQADLLKLTGEVKTLDSLSYLNRWFITRLDSIWTPVAHDLAGLPDNYDQGEAYGKYKAAREASFDLLMSIVPDIQGMLTDEQRRLLGQTALYLDLKFLKSIRASTAGSAI